MQQIFLFAICLAVIIPATWTIQKSVPKSECRQMMDMVVVVDGSDSILEKDYTKQRHAIKDMIEGMEVGENASRVGLVVFSTGIAQLVNLTGSLKVLRNKSLELEHPRDGTETHVGINAMVQMFKDHGREKVPWVCLVITDGLSKKPRLTKKASRKAKERGINIFAVGISHEIMQEELQNIASSPDQVLMLQTFDQLQVSLMSLMKVVCPCPDPPMVTHGIVDKGTRSIGSNRTYICEEGYQPIGMPRIRCKKDSTWTTLEFSCNACPDPLPVYRNGYVTEGLNLLLSTRQYICLKGYTAPEPLIAVCEAGPKGPFWKMPEKGCLACHKPPRFRDGYLDMKIVDTLVGTTRFYHCDEGFIATGPIETTCIDDKGIPTWTRPSHRCIACKKPPKLDYAVVDTTGGNRIGMKRIYKCIPGYHPTGPIEALCLGEKGAAFWKTSEHFCTACKEPPTVPNAVLHKDGDSLVGSIRTYICLKGFQPTGPIEVECKTSPGVAYWDGPKHKCVACIPPPVLPHAILDPLGDTLVGSIRNYNCMKGYIPNGPIEVGCIKGTGGPLWTSAEYHCIACPTPPPVQHALMDPAGDDLVGSKRLYHCMKGYIPSIAGPIMRECIGEYDVAKRRGKAFWSDPSHYCKACPDPPPIEFGKVEHGDSLIGSTRSYICLKGFYATGPIRIRCEKDGTWTKPKHSCTACGPVPFVDHADVDDGSHQLGTIRYYKCHQGYTHTNTPTIVCLKDAKWSAVNFSCVACEKPYGLKNAVLEPGENLIGIVRRYTCLPGYLATGPITSTCAVPPKMMKPDWSTPVHYCKDCGDPYPVDNAIPMKGQRTIGAVQQYVCKKGYVPSAPPLSHCMPNAEWTPPEFTCVVCKAPPKLNNAQVDKVGDTMVGTIRTYTCNTGYLATGPMEVICEAKQKDGYPLPYWKTQLDNYCKDCGTPPNITHAIWLNGAKTIGSIAQYVCETGYVPSGPPEIVCGRDATWANPAFTCTGCEITPDVQYAIPVAGVKALYTTGSVIVYECISGYVAIGTPKLVCQNDATWSPKQFHCKLTCGEPDIYIDAVVDTGGNLLDDVRYYTCNKGLKTVGDASVTCLKSGKWSARQFECAKCLPAPMLPYAIRMSDDTMIGSEVPYQCEDGYISDGPVLSTCLMDLTWSPSLHSCYGCSTTPVMDNTLPITTETQMYKIGTILTYQCLAGYVATVAPELRCQKDGTWSKKKFQCILSCGEPDIYIDAVVDTGGNLLNDIRYYTCNKGLKTVGDASVTCLKSGKWSARQFECAKCLPAPMLPYAIRMSDDTMIGSEVPYQCENGYISDGPVMLTCLMDLSWSPSKHSCYGCSTTPVIDNTLPITTKAPMYKIGTILAYQCLAGYVATGAPELLCQKDGTWSKQQFQCILSCGEPDIYIDADVDTGGNLLNDIRYYTCKKGLKTVGDASVTCLESGKWSARKFECAKCLPAPVLPYAIRMSDDTMIGSEVPYQCEDGYISDGPVMSTCLMDLTWSLSLHSCYGCSTTPVIDNTLPITTKAPMYKIGTILTYQCLAGYVATGAPELLCQKDGTWSKQKFQCILSCGEPDIYIDAVVDTGGNLLNDIRYYTCKKGLKTVGDASVTCLESGKWSARKFKCAKCLPAPVLPYAIRMSDDTMIGSEVPYQCEDGYISDGPVMLTCLMDLTWSPSLHSCYGCSTTPVIDNTLPITTKAPMYKIGTILTYQCLAGYVATAAPELRCQKDGTWSKQKFQCILSCGEPDIYIDADVDTGGNLLNDIRYYTCKKGLKTVGDASVTCLESGKWSARKFECAKCLPAPVLPYAIRMSDDTMIGSEVPYQCEDGYISDGPVMLTCLMDLTWSPSLHSCYGCSTTPVIDNTLPITTKAPMYKIGTILTYQCLAGYVATATPELRCQKDGTWSKQQFQCILSCGEPDIYIDADVDTGGNLLNDIRYYTCKKGLKTVGDASVTCLESGKWSARKFECAKCLPAPVLPYAIRMSDDTMIGSEVPYQCEDGYISDGPVISTCLMDLTWSPSKHSCYGCSMTPVIDNTLPITTKVQMYKIGTILTYQCLAGYVATAAPELRCQKDGTWSIQEFQCILSCGEPDIYIDAVVDVGGNLLNDTRYYTCNKGLKTVGDASVTCLKSGKWSARQFECAKCLPAPMLPYAIRMSDDTMIGSEVPYQCEDGYISDGPVISTCLMDLTWSPSLYTCYGCSTTPVIDNTLPITTKSPMYKIGTILTYQCLARYVATAAPELRCKKDGTWSKQKFQCILSCGEPPNYTEAILETGGTLLGDVRRYKCVQGLKTEGEPTITCLPSGIWSKRFFNCTKCLPAPILDYAVPLPGESFIGSEVVYECKEGLKSDGPVVSMCQKNLSWSTPINKCYDCGVPPTVPHAYLTLGKTTIGSIRRYTCEANYDMSGSNDTIVCLPDAKWSVPQFSCYVRTTTTTTTPAPVKGDPSVCDRCRMLNGVGFIGHPSDCTKYVQCYYSRRGVEAVYQPCPFSQYWDQADLTCKPAEAVDCPAERCLNPKLDSYKHTDSEKCCAYWVCINGKSVAKCCGKGYRFVDERGCVEDPTCNALCPWEDEVPMCDKRPLHDITRFEQHVGNGYWVKMSCGPGTGFNIVDCACTLNTVVVPGFACKPEILLDFNHNVINDASGRNVHIYNEGVYPYKGAAYFNGRSRLIINRFSNTEFRGHLVVKLRYKEQLRGPTGNMLQALITNGDCGDDPSIIVAKMPGYVLLGAKTDRPKSFALPTLPKDWKEVIYIHDEQRLEGKVCGASYSKWSWGPIRSTHCGIQIGHGTNLFNYTGLIDDITLYQCRPQDSVLTVYGGRTRKTNNRRPPTINVH